MEYIIPQTTVKELQTRYSVLAANSEGKGQYQTPPNQEYTAPARRLYV